MAADQKITCAVVTASLSRAGGGVYEISRRLAQGLAQSIGVEVFGLQDEFIAEDLGSWEPLHPRVFSTEGPRSYGYAPELRQALDASNADLAHVHGLWMYPSLAAARW